jgi:hypothetical protein
MTPNWPKYARLFASATGQVSDSYSPLRPTGRAGSDPATLALLQARLLGSVSLPIVCVRRPLEHIICFPLATILPDQRVPSTFLPRQTYHGSCLWVSFV